MWFLTYAMKSLKDILVLCSVRAASRAACQLCVVYGFTVRPSSWGLEATNPVRLIKKKKKKVAANQRACVLYRLSGLKFCPVPDHFWHSHHHPHPIPWCPSSILTISPQALSQPSLALSTYLHRKANDKRNNPLICWKTQEMSTDIFSEWGYVPLRAFQSGHSKVCRLGAYRSSR